MGIHILPAVRDYWSADLRVNVVADNMNRNRFEKIRSNLHFVDNSLYITTLHQKTDYGKFDLY